MRLFCQLWMISVAVIYMSNANALVLGEIQVISHLGQPLMAKIALADLGAMDVQQLKIRLADVEAYNKTELQYPDGHKFQFRLINKQGTQPFIRVITPYPINEPYLNLLVETVSESGKFIKAYTFLLDPSPSWQREPTNIEQPLVSRPPVKDAAHQTSTETRPGEAVDTVADKQTSSAMKRKKNKRATPRKLATQATPGVLHGATAIDQERAPPIKLTMSLSISSHDPTTGATADALHEELIAKEKTLEDLNTQLSAMQAAIKSLQDRLSLSNQLSVDAASGIQPSSEAASSVLNTEQNTSTLQTPSPSVQPLPEPETFFEVNRLALAFMALLLAVSGLVWYRKSQDGKKNPFDDDLDETTGSPLMPQYQLKEITSPVMMPPLTEKNAAPVIASFTTEKLATPVSASPVAVQQQVEPSFTETPEQGAPLLAEKCEQPATEPQTSENKVWPFDEQAIEASPHTGQTSEPIIPPEYAMLLEAKKHLRSGDDNLAEEVLIQAIRANPRNTYGYLVLLSIYEKRADKDSFAALSHRLKEIGDESSFAEAAEMGRKLDPDNPLYA